MKLKGDKNMLIKVERDEWRNIAHRLADVVKAAGCETYPTYQYYLELLEKFPTPVGDGEQA